MPVVDVHSHYVPRGWPDLAGIAGGDGWPMIRVDSVSEATIMLGDKEFRRITDACWNADRRLADMDADGVDVQVVSPTPVFFSYGRSPRQAADVSALFNDLALDITAEQPDRLVPFCQVPLQDADLACAELDRSIANGHRGVEIGNHVGDADLDSDGVVTFLHHCADRGVPVFVHPWDMPQSPRLDRWMGQWLVGMPAETHLSVLALVLSGAFDRLPASLRLAFAHGGGSFAFWAGRADNAWHQRRDVVGAGSEHPPSAYISRFSVDSVVFSDAALRLLVDVLGAEQVMMGSDYPYPFGERPAGDAVRRATLEDSDREALLGGNALRFLEMSAE
ncbi:MAG: amidohydrolase family protein [Actinomycetota bacterium]|nr:amidohydrolase family protein [Actinomycetota bacterium]